MTECRRLRLWVDPIACQGRGLCGEMLPELIVLDVWGFPMVAPGTVPHQLVSAAKEAVRACPMLALHLDEEIADLR
ncbi:MAG: ferredoxin [Acidimicrobiales bacterium]